MIKNKDELYLLLNDFNRLMPSAGFSFHFAYDGVQLEYNNGTATLTGFLTRNEMLDYMRAFRKGFHFYNEYASKEE
jgi:hypothetical protein